MKRRRLTDAGGLYLEVSPAGSNRWFWKFYPDGKESRLALGTLPRGDAEGRTRWRATKRAGCAQSGTNPVQKRKADKLAKAAPAPRTTFEAVAREFHATKGDGWSATYAREVAAADGARPVPVARLAAAGGRDGAGAAVGMKRVEARGAQDTAHALRQYAGQVFRYGIATGRCDRNPAADLRDALKPLNVQHMGAVLDPVKAGELLRDLHGYQGQPVTRAALLLSALTFQRPGNIRAMEWAEIDADKALWTIPAAKMKRTVHGKVNGRPHLVPLAPQALGHPGRAAAAHGPRALRVPVAADRRGMHEREHHSRGAAAHGLRQRRDDRARLPRDGAHADRREPARHLMPTWWRPSSPTARPARSAWPMTAPSSWRSGAS